MKASLNISLAAILVFLVLIGGVAAQEAYAAPSRAVAATATPDPVASTTTSSAPSDGILELGYQDIAWISATILASIPAQIRYQNMSSSDTGSLDRTKDLWLMDRWAAGNHSNKAALASDLALYPLLSLPMAVTAWESYRGRQTWGAAFAEALVYSEAMFISSSLALLVRSTRIHPRPLVYHRDVPAKERLSGEASGSFYSGHSNASFLSAVYFSYAHSLRHPDSEYQGWIWAGTLGIASTVAGLRIAAGKHYLSDVLVGAAAGSFFGWVFPYMHRRPGAGLPKLGMSLDSDCIRPVVTWTFR